MEELYKELLKRQKRLESQEYSEQALGRQKELNLVIVRVHQLIIPVVVGTLVCDLCNGTGHICIDGSVQECYSCNGTGKAN